MDRFRDQDQRLKACSALLATGGLERLWSAHGPTDEARELAQTNGVSLPPGDRALLLSAWSLWTGEPSPLRVDELVGLPEAEPILKLTIATIYGPRAVDVWLTRPDRTEGYCSYEEHEVHARAAELFDDARAVFGEAGAEAVNFTEAPDACALGAFSMATYLLTKGWRPIADAEKRTNAAMTLTVDVLGRSALDARKNAASAKRRARRRSTH